jgi:membrane-associated protease RseP (regulator of RpoE activity)
LDPVSSVPPPADAAPLSSIDPLDAGFHDRGIAYAWQRPRKFQDRLWIHALLLLLTFVATTRAGFFHYEDFVTDLGTRTVRFSTIAVLTSGLWYSLTLLAILGCHELGHYLACRYYDVDASLPFFLPFPFARFGFGTLGAFIRIREPIPSKRQLFDIGIAGPIAGFLIAAPAVLFGLSLSRVTPLPANYSGLALGDPLLFRLGAQLIWGQLPDGYILNLHPVAVGAWFGLLATALNLFPIGQLDGGHISYAVFGRRSSHVTLAMIGFGFVLVLFSVSWAVWLMLTITMLMLFGRHHPRTFDESVPLDAPRKWLALFAVVMFALCFTPAPIQWVGPLP